MSTPRLLLFEARVAIAGSRLTAAVVGLSLCACGENTARLLFRSGSVTSTQDAGTGAHQNGTASTGGTTGDSNNAGGKTGSNTVPNSGGTTNAGGADSAGGKDAGGASSGGTTNTATAVSAIGAPIGFAATSSDGLSTTTGGGLREPNIPTTCTELAAWLTDTAPRVIVLQQGINCRRETAETISTCQGSCAPATNDTLTTVYRLLPPGSAGCASVNGGSASDTIVQKQRNETIISVGSNKTLLGANTSAAIWGATLYLQGSSNVIIQNVAVGEVNPLILGAGDAITIDAAHHVWIDHCRIWNVSDGFVDVINGAQAVTVSWNLFQGRNSAACGGHHNQASTADGASVTYHHNFFDATLGASPRLLAGAQAHLFNNCWSNVLVYSIQVATQSQALIEANEFDDAAQPYYAVDGCFAAAKPCGIRASESKPNLFVGVSQTETHETGGVVDPLPYDASTYSVTDAASAKAEVIAQAGNSLTL